MPSLPLQQVERVLYLAVRNLHLALPGRFPGIFARGLPIPSSYKLLIVRYPQKIKSKFSTLLPGLYTSVGPTQPISAEISAEWVRKYLR